VRWDVSALPPRTIVPSLLLQPVLENAIGHGIEPLPQGGTVDVRGWLDGAAVIIEVTNPTVAMSERRASPNGNRMALDNIRQRLELAYPGRSGVEVDDQDRCYRVRLWFPRVGDDGAPARAEAASPEPTGPEPTNPEPTW
jgi:two-component system sensor histidine kinase AlgZ